MAILSTPRTASRPPVVRRRVVRTSAAHGRAGLFASGYARMGTGIYRALGVVAAHGRGLAPVAMVVAGLVVLTAAGAYTEGISMFPEAGGSAALARHAFDELTSFLTGWASALALIATAALSAIFAVRYLSVFWDP